MSSSANFEKFRREEKIDILLMQKLTAIKTGKTKDDKLVIEETQKKLDDLNTRSEEILDSLYRIRDFAKTHRHERDYEPVINREIKKYES